MTYIVSVLLHGSESWTLLTSDIGRLEAFHKQCQRQILCVRWQDMARNTDIAEMTGLPSFSTVIFARWAALVVKT